MVVGAGRALLEARGGRSGSLALLYSCALLVSAAINYPSLGYEQAERRRNPSWPVAHTHAGLGLRRYAVSARLTTFGSFRGVLVTITVTRVRTTVRRGAVLPSTFRFRGGESNPRCRRYWKGGMRSAALRRANKVRRARATFVSDPYLGLLATLDVDERRIVRSLEPMG
jgi:hypothetical protein